MLVSVQRPKALRLETVLWFLRKIGSLLEFVFRVAQLGFTQGSRRQEQVEGLIVSLTSIPERIGFVWLTIESIRRQTVLPENIILVLSAEQFPEKQVPRSLRVRQKRGLTILFEEGDRGSYKKLLPVIQRFPAHSVITIDDDVLYRKEMIEHFLKIAVDVPDTIIGSRGRKLSLDGQTLSPYSTWPLALPLEAGGVVLTGHGGVLYPAGAFEELSEDTMFMGERLCPNADDIWFWALALAAGRSRIVTKKRFYLPNYLVWAGKRLYSQNNLPTGNDKHLAEAIGYFGFDLERASDL